ncbi:hypothetical protein [Nocardioides sp. URHA0020]|uniref:hypothetical protein n=1 Tax=Nocardioides sp. URHA0020 TaxID=1380392 RepID=UPI00048D5A5F|nr:hypothetical protein [Nocardioides sp. URHA0020]
MDPVEERLVHPFYLEMMGLNALLNAEALWDDLALEGRRATEADVKQLLAPNHWRPVVMGSWFSLKFGRDQVGGDLASAIGLCRGTLTAPPLSVAAAIVIGDDAVPTLLDYIERDLERQYGSATFVAAVVEVLGSDAPVSPEDRDRGALGSMLAVAHRLRSALAAD